MQQLILGTGTAIWWLTEPHWVDIDFFIFNDHFRIRRTKFLKFERDQNAAENFQTDINESEKLQTSGITHFFTTVLI